MDTEIGRKINANHPGTTGSLGCNISEAVEVAKTTEGYRYVLGSVLKHRNKLFVLYYGMKIQ